MEVILLERISRLGQMGDTVKVKDGYARNFLLPKGKALRANDANTKKFEGQRAQLEARNLERKSEAQQVADQLDGKSFIVVRSAGETGQLYGSVSTRDIADLLAERASDQQTPIVIARNKADLADSGDLGPILARLPDVPVVPLSAATGNVLAGAIEGARPGQKIGIEFSAGGTKASLEGEATLDDKTGSIFAEASGIEVKPVLAVLKAEGPIAVKTGETSQTLSDVGRAEAVEKFSKDCTLQ